MRKVAEREVLRRRATAGTTAETRQRPSRAGAPALRSPVRSGPPPEADWAAGVDRRLLADTFKLLSDSARVDILAVLASRQKENVTELCRALRKGQPAVSHHLALLRSAQVVVARRRGKNVIYSVNPDHSGLAMIVAFAERAGIPELSRKDERALRQNPSQWWESAAAGATTSTLPGDLPTHTSGKGGKEWWNSIDRKGVALLAKLMSEETRALLPLYVRSGQDGERYVGEMARQFGQSQPAMSHHLQLMRKANVLCAAREGKRNYYSFDKASIEYLVLFIRYLLATAPDPDA